MNSFRLPTLAVKPSHLAIWFHMGTATQDDTVSSASEYVLDSI